MQVTKIGHGTLDNEHLVFCVVDHDKLVMSSVYRDKQEYGMYWFEEWVNAEIKKPDTGAIDFSDVSRLDDFSGYSAITRIEKPKPRYKQTNHGPQKIQEPFRRDRLKVSRNSKCFCGSGLKLKKCCLPLED